MNPLGLTEKYFFPIQNHKDQHQEEKPRVKHISCPRTETSTAEWPGLLQGKLEASLLPSFLPLHSHKSNPLLRRMLISVFQSWPVLRALLLSLGLVKSRPVHLPQGCSMILPKRNCDISLGSETAVFNPESKMHEAPSDKGHHQLSTYTFQSHLQLRSSLHSLGVLAIFKTHLCLGVQRCR